MLMPHLCVKSSKIFFLSSFKPFPFNLTSVHTWDNNATSVAVSDIPTGRGWGERESCHSPKPWERFTSFPLAAVPINPWIFTSTLYAANLKTAPFELQYYFASVIGGRHLNWCKMRCCLEYHGTWVFGGLSNDWVIDCGVDPMQLVISCSFIISL